MAAGSFDLRSPRDLLAKLHHDLRRLEAEPLDQYAAFDFFVTAWHMLDWIDPGEDQTAKDRRKAIRDRSVILKVCDHLASGSKHFQATAKRHDSVKATEHHRGAFSSGFSRGFDTSMLCVHLEGQAAVALGAMVEVVDLARLTLAEIEGMVI